jgi:hypothetical protein
LVEELADVRPVIPAMPSSSRTRSCGAQPSASAIFRLSPSRYLLYAIPHCRTCKLRGAFHPQRSETPKMSLVWYILGTRTARCALLPFISVFLSFYSFFLIRTSKQASTTSY